MDRITVEFGNLPNRLKSISWVLLLVISGITSMAQSSECAGLISELRAELSLETTVQEPLKSLEYLKTPGSLVHDTVYRPSPPNYDNIVEILLAIDSSCTPDHLPELREIDKKAMGFFLSEYWGHYISQDSIGITQFAIFRELEKTMMAMYVDSLHQSEYERYQFVRDQLYSSYAQYCDDDTKDLSEESDVIRLSWISIIRGKRVVPFTGLPENADAYARYLLDDLKGLGTYTACKKDFIARSLMNSLSSLLDERFDSVLAEKLVEFDQRALMTYYMFWTIEVYGDRSIQGLTDFFLTDENVRKIPMSYLPQYFGLPKAHTSLITVLRDQSKAVNRSRATTYLSYYPSESATAYLLECLSDRSCPKDVVRASKRVLSSYLADEDFAQTLSSGTIKQIQRKLKR